MKKEYNRPEFEMTNIIVKDSLLSDSSADSNREPSDNDVPAGGFWN